MDLREPTWLVDGLLADDSVTVISGEPKSTKTWAALEILLAVATATPAFARFKPGPVPHCVVAFLFEESLTAARRRLRALISTPGLRDRSAFRNVYLNCRGRMDLLKAGEIEGVIQTLQALPQRPAVVLFDPLVNLASTQSENDAREMTAVMDALRRIRDEVGCAVLVVHHAGKGGRDNSGRRGGQKMRGSSAVHGALDCGIHLSNVTGDKGRLECRVETEARDGQSAGKFGLVLDVIDGEDRRAIAATWTAREAGAVSQTRDPHIDKLAAILREAWKTAQQKGATPVPLTQSQVRVAVGCQMAKVSSLLAALSAEGRAKQVKKGWVYIPSADEVAAGAR